MKLLGPRECTKENHSSQGRCFLAPAQNQLISPGEVGVRPGVCSGAGFSFRLSEEGEKQPMLVKG